MPVRRLLAAGFVALGLLALNPAARADPLADAKARQQKLQAELDKATRELADLENKRFWSDKSLQTARGRRHIQATAGSTSPVNTALAMRRCSTRGK